MYGQLAIPFPYTYLEHSYMNHDNEQSQTDTPQISSPISRQALYDLVWSEPMLKVAVRFDVSSSYMARICTLMNVPRPERGYWAKLVVGKAPKQPPLPEPRPGDLLEWSRDGTTPKLAKPQPRPPDLKRRRPRRPRTTLPDQHPLTTDAKPYFEAGRLSYTAGYLKPAKKLLIDLAVTKSGLDKALSFANQLFLALEARGYRVLIAPTTEYFHRPEVDERENPETQNHYNNLWSPQRCTVAYIGTVAIGITIIELSERLEAKYVNGEYVRVSDYVPKRRGSHALDSGWTSKHNFPTGRLCLQAYSPYPRTEWTQQWREVKNRELSSRIPAIVRELENATVEIARLYQEGEREAELERQRWAAQMEQWEREQMEKRSAQALKESKEELLEIIEMWATSKRLEAFFTDAEQRLAGLSEGDRDHTMKRLQNARALIGSIDALERFQTWRAPEERQ